MPRECIETFEVPLYSQGTYITCCISAFCAVVEDISGQTETAVATQRNVMLRCVTSLCASAAVLLLLVASDGEYNGVRLPGYWKPMLLIFSLVAGELNPTTFSNRSHQMWNRFFQKYVVMMSCISCCCCCCCCCCWNTWAADKKASRQYILCASYEYIETLNLSIYSQGANILHVLHVATQRRATPLQAP